jgi:hypothetical protein
MITIERAASQEIRVGPYTLRVVAVRPTEVVVAIFGPGMDDPDDNDVHGALPREGATCTPAVKVFP